MPISSLMSKVAGQLQPRVHHGPRKAALVVVVGVVVVRIFHAPAAYSFKVPLAKDSGAVPVPAVDAAATHIALPRPDRPWSQGPITGDAASVAQF